MAVPVTRKVASFVLAFLSAFIIMMVFEYVNSLLFPFPAGMDVMNLDAVRSFTDNLPWTGYILVFVGWMVASFVGGFIVTRVSKTSSWIPSFMVGLVLTALGIVNFLMIQHPAWMIVLGVIVFIAFALLGGKLGKMKEVSA